MKTNESLSQFKQTWEQANVTFGKAQAVREAVDRGGIVNGVFEGINQFCGDKPNMIAQALVKIKDTTIGKFLIKHMCNINFNDHGDTLTIDNLNLAKETGQEGQLGGLLLQLVDGQSKWLSKLTCNICNTTSKFISNSLDNLIQKIPDENIQKGIKSILSKNVDSSKSHSKEETKKARERVFEEIKKQIGQLSTMSDLNEMIEDRENVRLKDIQKDKLKILWAIEHGKLTDGSFVKKLFKSLSSTTKEALGYDDTSQETKKSSYNDAIGELQKKNGDNWNWLDNYDW